MDIRADLVDITTLPVDAIVNAANEALTPGGGVSGAIHRAAGPELATACARVAPCPTGQARITPGFALPARYVIHAVGPVWRGGLAGEPALLAATYRSILELSEQHGIVTLALPAISTGIYGYPLRPATQLAASIMKEFLPVAHHLGEVLFACFSADALAEYRLALSP